ncbi:MAG: M28 family peptidase, partial [Saprospiraceae bacterium]|nr:M28 family peptidase [Saprospiraceae bacterium]
MRYLRFIAGLFLILYLSGCEKDVPVLSGQDRVLAFANSIQDDKVFPWVEQLCAVQLSDSPIDNTGFPPEDLFPSNQLRRTAAVGFVADALKDLGYNVDTVALGEEPQVAYNIVAEKRGSGKPDEVVLVACHLDAFYAGADDNTSAVAAMLEIARAAQNVDFESTLRFVAFDLEEYGSVGSTRYIQAGYADDVKAAVVMDLIGYASSEPGSQDPVFGVQVPDVGDYLFVIGNGNSQDETQQTVSLAHTTGLGKTVGILAPQSGNFFISSVFMRS